MYMSYVLDFRQELLKGNYLTYALKTSSSGQENTYQFVTIYTAFYVIVKDDQCFILTTDADVKFTHRSVEALIEQIIEDPKTVQCVLVPIQWEMGLSFGIKYLTMPSDTGFKRYVSVKGPRLTSVPMVLP